MFSPVKLTMFVPSILLFAASVESAEAPRAVVIRGCAVLDVTAGVMRPARTVVIGGGVIQQIATTENSVTIPPGAQTVAAEGKFLIPGLIDAHVHLVHVLDSAQMTGDEILPLFLAAGVTAVRDIGDEIVAETLVARMAELFPDRSPRVFKCSPLIDSDPPFHRDIGRAVTDPHEVRSFVDEMVKWNVTALKIYVGTGREVGRAVIAEGHRRGLKVAGHLGAYGAPDAVADGIDVLEHIWSVFNDIIPPEKARRAGHRATLNLDTPLARDLIGKIADAKTVVDPTLIVFRNMILLNDQPEYTAHADNAHVPARLARYWNEYKSRANLQPSTLAARRGEMAKYRELTGRLYRAGVVLLAGTDSPEPFVSPGFSLHQELEQLVDSGLPLAEALRCATIHNATALGQADRLGSIEVGKLADLILLDANPLENITHTRAIRTVFRGGVVVDPKVVLRLVPTE
jgi:imidazolonepropionase-like amidohydrolase